MRSSMSSTLVSRMIAVATNPTTDEKHAERPVARVHRIVWAGQAAAVKTAIPCHISMQIEAAVTADLDAMEMPEVFFTSVEVFNRVITCDLDSSGTASIFGIIDPTVYDELVEEAGDEALFGVDHEGVYLNPARTRH
jgi:hypothetical protein